MRTITLVTGNPHKLQEWRRLLPPTVQLDFADTDLDEIQSLDLEAVAIDKAHRAYEQLHKPVVVEDIAFAIEKFNGLPGPFVKFFQKQMGKDAMYQLVGKKEEAATAICVLAYYDGKQTICVRADVKGKIGPARGDYGFGFDFCFIPEGYSQTYAEMGPEQKDKISHRSKAIKKLFAKQYELKVI